MPLDYSDASARVARVFERLESGLPAAPIERRARAAVDEMHAPALERPNAYQHREAWLHAFLRTARAV